MNILPFGFLSSLSDYENSHDGSAGDPKAAVARAISVDVNSGLFAHPVGGDDENFTPLLGATVLLMFPDDVDIPTVRTDSPRHCTYNNIIYEEITFEGTIRIQCSRQD